jgi:sugar lactone lactonase YvrE
MKITDSHPSHRPQTAAVHPPTFGLRRSAELSSKARGRARPWALLVAAVLLAGAPAQGALQGPVFPPPGGFLWEQIPGVATNADGAGGKTGGMNWFFSEVALATNTVTYWGASNVNAIAMSFYSPAYTNGEHLRFALGLSDLAQGRLVWAGRTPLRTPAGWWDLAEPGSCTTTQSSTLSSFLSDSAIDGSTTTITHTLEGDPAPWWEVTFAAEAPIETIYLYNRRDCCGDRLRDITVHVLASDGSTNWTSPVLNPTNELASPLFLQVTPPTGTSGQRVKVCRNVDGIPLTEGPVLSLSEVEVHAGIQTRFTVTVTNLADNLPLRLTNAMSVGLPADVGGLVRVTPGLAFQANLLFEAALPPNGPFQPALELFDQLSVSNHWFGTQAYSTFTSGFYYYDLTIPTIDQVPDQITARGVPSGPHAFSVGDDATPLDELVVTASSDDQILVPDANIELTGTGAGRQILVTPGGGASGSCTITVRVDDGFGFATMSFILTVDDPPTVTPLSNLLIQQDTSTGPLSFTIGDTETPAAGLLVAAYSGNPELVPPANLILGGNDTQRTLTVTPLPGLAGQALITLTVEDAAPQAASATFLLTVNGRPTITDLPDLLVQQDTATAPLTFTIGDLETNAADLTLVGDSSNTNLVPVQNIVFGGSDSDRTVTVTPTLGRHGQTTIAIGVADGSITNFDTFVLTVNGRPTISDIPDQTAQRDQATAPIPFVIGDPETPADQLVVTAASGNVSLIPQAGLTLGGSGTNRTLTITPARGRVGLTTITVAVADASITNLHSFELKVNSPPSPAVKQDMVVQRGGSVTITDQFLLYTDLESGPTELVYTVASNAEGFLPHYGWLYLNGVAIERGGTFTQDDVDQGRVTYTHDGQCGANDDFSFFLSDPDGGISGLPGGWSFEFLIQHPNVKPVTVNGDGVVPLGNRFQGILEALNEDCTPQTLVFRVVLPPAHGTVTLDNPFTGAFSYVPAAGYSGQDSFTFQVNDGVVDADVPGTFTLTMANSPPATSDGQGTTREDTPFLGQFTGSDPDLPAQALTFMIENQPSKGSVAVTDAGVGRFTYTPNLGAFGEDAFTFRVTDGLTNSAIHTFTISIWPRLDPGDLLVTDMNSRSLLLIDPTGTQFRLSSTNLIQWPEGLAVESQGTIIVKDKSSGLVRVNPTDGSQTLLSPATNFIQDQVQAFSLAVEADGSILVPDGTNGLLRVNPTTGGTSVLAAGAPLVNPRGVVVASDGTIFVSDPSALSGETSRVVRVNPGTGTAALVATNNLLILPTTLTVDRQGMLLVADAGSYAGAFDSIIRVNPINGSQTALCTNGLLHVPTGLALGSDGTIFVANLQGQSVVKIDPVTGAQSPFTSGGLLTMPIGLAIVPLPSAELRVTLIQITPQEGIVRLEGNAGQDYELWRSADLVSWSRVAEGTAGPDGVLDLHDTNPPTDKAFYRATEQ